MEEVFGALKQLSQPCHHPSDREDDRLIAVRDGESGQHNPHKTPFIRLDTPRFDSTDPYNWVFQIGEYFAYHNTPEEKRLQLVSFHFDGRASSWFQWLKHNRMLNNITWDQFLLKVQYHFGSSRFDDHEGNLAKLVQHGTVDAFQSEFEDLMNKTRDVSEALLISFFISGLKPNIRRELQFHRPPTLEGTFAVARSYEGKLLDS